MAQNRRLFVLALLVAVSGALSFSLARRPSPTYVTERYPHVLLHRPANLSPKATGPLVRGVQEQLAQQQSFGYLNGTEEISVWVLPHAAPWPAGLARPPVEQPIVAVAPFTLVARSTGLADPYRAGLTDAVAVAVTQPSGSPAFTQAWLYTGMAEVWQRERSRFPTGYYRDSAGQVLDARRLLAELARPSNPLLYRQAAAALAAFLMDRWGVDWPRHGRAQGIQLTPPGALAWTTGTEDPVTALARWRGRMGSATVRDPRRPWLQTLAEISPVRLRPTLPALPTGPGPRPNASPHSYAISARYDPDHWRLTGQERLQWQNREGIPLDTLYFNLWPNTEQFALYGGRIEITGVRVDGKPVPFEAHALDLAVPLGRRVEPGQQVEVTIDFTTHLPSIIPYRLFGQSSPDRFNLVHWYPQLAVLDDRGWNLQPFPGYPGEPYQETADYQVTLDVPAGTQVGATGRLVKRTEQGDRWLYQYDAPKVRDWAATGGRNLAERVVEAEGVSIQVLHSDPDFVEAVARETARALPIFTQRFGPYPYSTLVVSCCAGVEYPGLFFTTPVTPGNETWRVTVYHELAHQWFYGLVGNDQYTEPWLDEAFARFADRIASRELDAPVAAPAPAGFRLPPGLHISSSSREYAQIPTIYGPGVYTMGADALEALEREIGTLAFARLIREWVDRYRYQIATTADFVRQAEEVSGRKLGDFFARQNIFPTDRVPYQPLIPWPEPTPLSGRHTRLPPDPPLSPKRMEKPGVLQTPGLLL